MSHGIISYKVKESEEYIMKKITELTCFGRTFVIAQDDVKRYWGFEKFFVGEKGELLKEFNGISGFMDLSLNKTIKRVQDHCYIQAEMASTGKSSTEIVMEMIQDELGEDIK